MLIQAAAALPLRFELLGEALEMFAEFAQRSLSAVEGAEVSISVVETGSRANAVLASLVPAETKEFGLGMLPTGTPLTAAEFRESMAQAKPKKTRSQIRLSAAAVDDPCALLKALAKALPPSGRGIILVIGLQGWKIAGDGPEAAVDVTFTRFSHGAHAVNAVVALRFHALSRHDPVVEQNIASASERLNLRFGRPGEAFAANVRENLTPQPSDTADPRLHTPSAEAQLVVLQSFEEAMARAADKLGTRTEELAEIPLLFSRSGGFDKRMKDRMEGKKESVNLPAHLKRFMKENFPEYRQGATDPEQLSFCKPVAPTLDLILMFDKVHQWGLGKSFSVEFAADFPNTPFGGMHTGAGTRKNIFWVFHEAWEKKVWSYTTSAELATALAGCGDLLKRLLPALEEQCRELLLPVPSALPAGIPVLGALSARQAHDVVLPMAQEWAGDVELESVGSMDLLSFRGLPASSVSSGTATGRIDPPGSWAFKFISKRLDKYCWYTVPHTGRVWWSFYSVLQGAIPKYSSVLRSDDWCDSTEVAPRAFQAVEEQLGEFHVEHLSLALRDPTRYGGGFLWEATFQCRGKSPSEHRLIIVQLDRRTGAVLGCITR